MTDRAWTFTVNARLVIWIALGCLLIYAGFLVESLTDPVHHVLLIAGGICTGLGLSSAVEPRG